ncbi:Fat1 homolog [Talaromyces pinophilus]|uniref:Very long-chain fatty acid transport protein n=1 Tax=Talaromyces pinophilus TaxID=128442 RepID=A0A6V8HJV2_TALPI|nr:Fat1 homolog [Talaromyces pinophilus]
MSRLISVAVAQHPAVCIAAAAAMPPLPALPPVPLKYAVPALGTLFTYLNAKWSMFYDYLLIKSLAKINIKLKLAERADRLNLFYVLEKHALAPKSANRPFIVYNGQTWTYKETYDTVLRYGQYFKQTYGIKPKEIVALDFMNSATYIFIWLGLSSIGAIPAFINYNLSGKPLSHCVKVSTARLVVADQEIRDKFTQEQLAEFASPDFRDGKGPVDVVFITPEVENQILQAPAIREDDSVRSNAAMREMALLIYTSGTTGYPKPAVVSLSKCWSGALFMDGFLSLKTDDRVYTCMPLYHATGAVLGFCAVLFKGATIVVGHKFSAKNFWNDARDGDATIIQYVGETMRYLLAVPKSDLDKKHRIRLAYGNGMRPDVWANVKERFGIETIAEFYSSTEGFSGHWNRSANDFSAGAIGRNGLIGELLLGRTMALVEVDHEKEIPRRDPATGFCMRVPRGEPGELLYALDPNDIAYKYQGYFNNSEASEKKILRDVFAKGDAWFRTGDTLKWDTEGRWYFTDRIGDTFRWKSENVSTNEVAEVLGSHPDIAEANVYGVSLPHHDGRAGCAAIILKNGAIDVPSDILESLAVHVLANLPRYALPLFLRVTAELERTGNNKQPKHILRQEGVDPAKVSAKDRLYWLRGNKYVPFTPEDWARLSAAQVMLQVGFMLDPPIIRGTSATFKGFSALDPCNSRLCKAYLSYAATIASSFLSKFQSRGPQTRTQLLDANQLHLLTLTLNRPHLYPSATTPKDGTPLPPGYHLVYFTPLFLESELGADGTDTSYNPSAPFTRRMWAGGEVRWPRNEAGKPNLLRVGQTVTETTRVISAEPKVVRKTGEEMIVVGVEKRFENEDGVAVVDRRNWVFREALPYPPQTPITTADKKDDIPYPIAHSNPPSNPQQIINEAEGTYRRPLRQTPVSLFRFSALTFNPHKIHYSVPWSRDVEGHRNIVVHGPLNLINMLDFWRDIQYSKLDKHGQGLKAGGEEELIVPESIAYRATNPLYADEDYEIVLEKDAEKGVGKVNVFNHNGVVSMKADIKA